MSMVPRLPRRRTARAPRSRALTRSAELLTHAEQLTFDPSTQPEAVQVCEQAQAWARKALASATTGDDAAEAKRLLEYAERLGARAASGNGGVTRPNTTSTNPLQAHLDEAAALLEQGGIVNVDEAMKLSGRVLTRLEDPLLGAGVSPELRDQAAKIHEASKSEARTVATSSLPPPPGREPQFPDVLGDPTKPPMVNYEDWSSGASLCWPQQLIDIPNRR